MKMEPTEYLCMFSNYQGNLLSFAEQRKRAEDGFRKVLDITKPDNAADTIVTIRCSGNALVSVLNALQSGGALYDKAKAEAISSNQYPYSLELYAVIEQLRDQLSEERMRNH